VEAVTTVADVTDPSSETPELRLAPWLRAVFALDPAAPAFEFEGSWRLWAALSTAVDGLDAELAGHGWGSGTLVGVVMRNRPEIVRASAAILATDRCLVTLSSVIPSAALADEVRRLELPVVIASAGDWSDELCAAVREAGSLALCFDDDQAPPRTVEAAGVRSVTAETSRPGVAVQMLTSGTTGRPKRVDLLTRSLEHEIVSTSAYSGSNELSAPRLASGCSILWTPMVHIGGLRGLITNLVAGRRIALMERFAVEPYVALVREHRPKAISLVPSALRMVLDADVPADAFESVQAVFAGTAPLPPETADEFLERYGVPVLEVYGATEFAGGVAGWTLRDWREFGTDKRGSVGRANRGVEMRIVDETTGEPLPSGEQGLLEVRAAQLAQPGWVRTTDLGRIDVDGFLWIVGRADDVIIRGGFKVATNHVADVLRRHPAVLDASVIGVADERLGQVPVAAVELGAGEELAGEELVEWSRDHLSPYQVPVRVLVVERLPRTPSMKVSQPGVRALLG
jgi:long-chain acyl-CoA synthetase